jgi:hypothetical protein
VNAFYFPLCHISHSTPDEIQIKLSETPEISYNEIARSRKRVSTVWDHFIMVEGASTKNQYGFAICRYCKDGYETSQMHPRLLTARPRNLQTHLKTCPFFNNHQTSNVSRITSRLNCQFTLIVLPGSYIVFSLQNRMPKV